MCIRDSNIGLKFAFRSTDLGEVKQTLEFFGIDKNDENNQKRLRDLENGQCPVSYTHLLHGGIIPVSVPPEVPLREFPYNAVVELVNPVALSLIHI